MSNRDEYAQIYEQSLQQARASLLHSTFDQFWIQSETCPLIQGKPSTEKNDFLSDASRPPSRRFCRLCWKSPWSRSILIILPVLLLLLLSLPFIIRSQSRANHLLRQCSSLACLAASHRIVENLDLHRNPCENFFAYACGGWSNSRLLLPSETSTSYFKEIAKKNAVVLYELLKDNADTSFETAMKLKSFFNACMDRAANERTAQETLLRLLVQVGKSPILVRHWSPHHWNLLSSLVVTHQHKFHPLFRMSITVDEKNNQFHRIYLGQAGLSFEDTSLYHSEALRYLFNQIGTDLLQSLGYSSQSSAQLFHSMDEIFTFEQQLAHIFPRRHPINPWQSYHLFTFEQIHHYFHPWLDIGDYFERIFRKEKSFFYNQTILIGNPEYFERLSELIQTTPTHVLANYVTFQVIQEVWPYMPERFAQIRRPLLAHLKGVTEEKAWWEVCVKRTDDAFGFATGALFISKAFDIENKEKIEYIVEEIRLTFLETLQKIDWMDDQTRQQAAIKAKLMLKRLGYPKWLEDHQNIDRFYQNLVLSPANNSITNFLLVRRFHQEQNLKKLDLKPDIEEWTMAPIDVNAYYAPWKNMIVFPAGILQTPFFDPNVPISLNFGSIASIIGHELIHAFDARQVDPIISFCCFVFEQKSDSWKQQTGMPLHRFTKFRTSGRFFDGYGNLNNWWQTESARSFEQRAQCFIEQYSHYPVGNRHINGRLTLDENIADNGGLRIAYTAYRRYLKSFHLSSVNHGKHRQQQLLPGLNLTDEQLFYLGFAQTWCTKMTPQAAESALATDAHAYPKYRVIGALSNMPEFSRAFHCLSGSLMNPSRRCQIWSQSESA